MKIRHPVYASDFVCLAGACSDTCCRGWEIVLDPPARARYEAAEGDLGRRLRAAMEGGCFRLSGGFCPFLRPDRLCEIQKTHGETWLTDNCRTYPRFAEEYGALREWSLAISCPEAARLILSSPMALTETVTDEPVTTPNDLDPQLYFRLLAARQAAFDRIRDESRPAEWQLARILADAERFPGSARADPSMPVSREKRQSAQGALLRAYAGLEALDPDWGDLLRAAESADTAAFTAAVPAWDGWARRLIFYLLYRHYLKAAADGRMRVRFLTGGYLVIRALCAARWADCPAGFSAAQVAELAHRWGREIEHDEDNLDALLALRFGPNRLLAMLLG